MVKIKQEIIVFEASNKSKKLKNINVEAQDVLNQLGLLLYDKTPTTGWNGCLGRAQVIPDVIKKRQSRYICKIPNITNSKLLKYFESMKTHANSYNIIVIIEVV